MNSLYAVSASKNKYMQHTLQPVSVQSTIVHVTVARDT